MKKWKTMSLCFVIILFVSVLSACNNANQGDKVVYVGTMGTMLPFTYYDDDNNLTGYDVEVVRLLGSKIPGVTFEFITSPWDSLFLGLDSKRYDMVANQIAKSPEREEKYLFPDKGYVYVETQLVVHADDNTRKSLDDFAGETLGGITGDYFTEMMEEYNDEHGNPYKMQYYGEDYTSIFIDLDVGRIAGTLNDSIVVGRTAMELGLKIKCVGEVLEESYSYFCFRNDEVGRDLKAKVDQAMNDVIADGSLAKLSIEWFGGDHTK
jgi:L-cystine transport system substrate-binding protein